MWSYAIQRPSARVNQYLHSFYPFHGAFWNSPEFLRLNFLLPHIQEREYQDLSLTEVDHSVSIFFCILAIGAALASVFITLFYPWSFSFGITKRLVSIECVYV